MKFVLTIDMDNAAFEGRENLEVADIMKGVVKTLDSFSCARIIDMDREILRDVNGNKCGSIAVRP